MAKFNLADLLSDVSILDTTPGREQIEYIDIDLIRSDERNFYSIEGIENLMASIELLGLQQPVRVREADVGYIIVSGHRRAEALRRLAEEGKETYRDVPCIVEAETSSPELQELRLIYANSDTRTLSSAELAQQAARVEDLLYRLKEQGMEFPGRMRDHVAQACNVSRTKLARLKVIRDNLKPEALRKAYQDGRLNETAAYEIARRSESAQELADEQLDYIMRRSAEEISGIMDSLECEAKGLRKITKTFETSLKEISPDEYREKRWQEDIDFFSLFKLFAEAYGQRIPLMGTNRTENIKALKLAFRNSGGGSNELYYSAYGNGLELSSRKRGIKKISRSWTDVYDSFSSVAINSWADGLRSSSESRLNTGRTWRKDRPDYSGEFLVKMDCSGPILKRIAYYDHVLDSFYFSRGGQKIDAECLGWYPIPEEEEGKKNG